MSRTLEIVLQVFVVLALLAISNTPAGMAPQIESQLLAIWEKTFSVAILALIIRTAKNNYYSDHSALNRKQLNYTRVVFKYIRAVLSPTSKAVHHAQ